MIDCSRSLFIGDGCLFNQSPDKRKLATIKKKRENNGCFLWKWSGRSKAFSKQGALRYATANITCSVLVVFQTSLTEKYIHKRARNVVKSVFCALFFRPPHPNGSTALERTREKPCVPLVSNWSLESINSSQTKAKTPISLYFWKKLQMFGVLNKQSVT